VPSAALVTPASLTRDHRRGKRPDVTSR